MLSVFSVNTPLHGVLNDVLRIALGTVKHHVNAGVHGIVDTGVITSAIGLQWVNWRGFLKPLVAPGRLAQ